jgi:SAM-dependent methyltransferase
MRLGGPEKYLKGRVHSSPVATVVLNNLRQLLASVFPTLSTRIESLPSEIPERMVEVPFVFRELAITEGTVLDVGCTSPYNTLPLLLAEIGFDVYGLDVREFKVRHRNFKFVKGDIRKTNFPDSYFDRVLAISSIEHVGLAGRYTAVQDDHGDRRAILEITRILKQGGRLLMTVPFGRAKIVGSSHRVYDAATLSSLLSGLEVVKKEFYVKDRSGYWIECRENVAASVDASPTREPAVCCLSLSKT